jgi:hypothetical protein
MASQRAASSLLVEGDGVAMAVAGFRRHFLGDAVYVTFDGIDKQGGGFRRVVKQALGNERVVGLLGQRHLGVQLPFKRLNDGFVCLF